MFKTGIHIIHEQSISNTQHLAISINLPNGLEGNCCPAPFESVTHCNKGGLGDRCFGELLAEPGLLVVTLLPLLLVLTLGGLSVL